MLIIKNGAKKRLIKYSICAGILGLFVSVMSNGVAGYSLALNTSQSLSGTVYLVNQNDKKVVRNQLVAFVAPKTKYYSDYNRFIKYTWGVAGDDVQFDKNGTFYINGMKKGVAKSFTKHYEPLEHSESGTIPKGKFFVGTNHLDSFDSRYKLIGNIDEKNIIGRAYLLF
ncbi:signal peptidase I [Acinetobacter pittii]|uniref:signal peptidase I n=1 Tax=Acinetobacter calcoaceticus/baumannii complex TaxID=909768 RepID=UPI0029568929|nr:signal peptidase I [Acinetobacter baumannii]